MFKDTKKKANRKVFNGKNSENLPANLGCQVGVDRGDKQQKAKPLTGSTLFIVDLNLVGLSELADVSSQF